MNEFHYKNLQEAWEGIQEFIVNNEDDVRGKLGGYLYGTMLSLYDLVLVADRCWIDPKFDFGLVLGYSDKKWTKLINNYVNQDYLDLIKSEIKVKEENRKKAYIHTFHFDNKYGSGKDCLISLTIERRKTEEEPVLTFHTRASEITKRLLFDFLLIQRIAEYIYGKKQKCKVICHIVYGFINLQCFMMYISWKGWDSVISDIRTNENGKIKMTRSYTNFQLACKKVYKYFCDTPLEKIKYKVHHRAAVQVKKWEGIDDPEIPEIKSLYAKQLKLFRINQNQKLIQKLNEVYDTKTQS